VQADKALIMHMALLNSGMDDIIAGKFIQGVKEVIHLICQFFRPLYRLAEPGQLAIPYKGKSRRFSCG
jgi:hypothetical protein